MPDTVTVVSIRSLSYTGTTWLNAILGCNDRALALGPADRVWNIAQGKTSGPACLIHREQCDFWPAFLANYSPSENFFIALARHSGKSVVVTNNLVPTGAGSQLKHPDVRTKYIQIARDARVVAASYWRKFPDKPFLDAITGFIQPSLHYFDFDQANPEQLCLRYEEILADQEGALDKIGRFIGLDYDRRALRFWEWKLHLTHGNPGTIAMVRLGQGLPIDAFEGREFYETEFAKITTGNPYSFRDDRAATMLTRFDRYLFDCLAGPDNARLGYARDRFGESEVAEFAPILDACVASGKLPARFTDHVPVSAPNKA